MERSQVDTSLTHRPLPSIHLHGTFHCWHSPSPAHTCTQCPTVAFWVPVSICDLSSVQRHLINHLTFPQVHSFLLGLGPVCLVLIYRLVEGSARLSGDPFTQFLTHPWGSRSFLGWRLRWSHVTSAGQLGRFPTVLGDELFLERKLFKFSFSSDDLGGTWSTHVELKPHRGLAISGHVNWVLRQGMRHIPKRGRLWGMGILKHRWGRELPMGLLGGVEVVPSSLDCGVRATWQPQMTFCEVLFQASGSVGWGWVTVVRVQAADVCVQEGS